MTPVVWTFQDAVEHVLDTFDVDRSARAYRHARRAVLSAQRRFPSYHTWPYYQRSHVLNTVAAQSTGSITYDHTGGTNERELTLAGATWPSWAVFGVVRFAGVDYRIAAVISTTVVTLDANSNPGVDVAAGTAYSVFRARYPLPADFRKKSETHNVSREFPLDSVSPGSSHAAGIYFYNSPNVSWQTAIVEDPNYLGVLALEFSPAPATAQAHGFMYERSPRQLNTEKYATGTIATTADSTTIDGTGTTFVAGHLGAILRISTDADVPTAIVGSPEVDEISPPAYQRTIMEVTNGTTLEVDEAIPATVSGRGFTISDPIDVHVESMLDAYLRLAEYEYGRLSRRKDKNELQQDFREALHLAMDAARYDTSLQSANIGADRYYSQIGDVDVDP